MQAKLVKTEQENEALLEEIANEKADVQNLSEELGMTDLHSCVPGKDVEHMPGDVKTHKPNAHENSIFIWKTKRI